MARVVVVLLMALAFIRSSSAVSTQKPLAKAEVDELLASGKGSQAIATAVKERGIDFTPTEAYLEGLRAKGAKQEVLDALRATAPKPLSKSELRRLLLDGTADKAMATMVEQRGLDFWPSDDDLDELRGVGAGDLLDQALRKARQATPPPGYEVGKDVLPPVPTYNPSPHYTDKALRAKFSGVAVLAIVIDAEGNVTEARVTKPVGYGLDENAVETVKTWKFKPATRNGEPVAVRITVEVTFAYAREPVPASP
jgi:TonB family protein